LPPLDLQNTFAARYNHYQQAIQAVETKLQILDDIFATLLTRAFSGELTAHLSLHDFCQLTPRQGLLLALATYGMQTKPEPLTITPLVKQAFLWQQEQKPRLAINETALPYLEQPYVFRPYLYGPFSEEITTDLAALCEAGLLIVEKQPRDDDADNSKTLIMPGEEIALRDALLAEIPEPVRATAQMIAQQYGSMALDDLLQDVYSRYPEYTVESKWRGRPRPE
jgi:hypothetical protein